MIGRFIPWGFAWYRSHGNLLPTQASKTVGRPGPYMAAPPWNSRITRATRWLALLALLFFLAREFRGGWTELNTDFPNYYTAAVLIRQSQPLHNYYDWTWFQRQMNFAGVEHQLGSYNPQTPLTALPLLGLTEKVQDQPRQEKWSEVASHAVYGFVTESVRRLIRGR